MKGSNKEKKKETSAPPLCYDRKGNRLFAEDLVAMVEKEAEKRRMDRLPFELQWRLNTNFLSGNQHCDINVHRGTVENYEPLYEYMSREVFNRIAPIMETRLSHLKRVNYRVSVLPKSSEYEDRLKAELADSLITQRRNGAEYTSAFERILGLTELTGSAFIMSWWDAMKDFGRVGERERSQGQLPQMGDVAFTVLTPYEILPEDLYAEEVEEQPSLIVEQVKSVEELYDLYGVMLEGQSVDGCGYAALSGAGGLGYESGTLALCNVSKENALLLRTYMERPTAAYPEGRMIITAGGRLLHYGALPYDRYPICAVKSRRISGQFFGRSVIENLIPLQRSYNGIKNRINDYINRSTCGQLLIEEGSVDADDLTQSGLCPGAPIVYSRGATLPSLLETPALSDLACTQCEKLEKDMEYAAGVSGMLAGGSLPSAVSSAVAIEILQDLDTTRLSLYADNVRKGILTLCDIWLSIYKRYITVKRTLCMVGAHKRSAAISFLGEDLEYSELYFESENELQVREEEQRQKYLEVLKLGLFSDEKGALSSLTKAKAVRRLLGKGESIDYAESEIQLDNARNENAELEQGREVVLSSLDDHALHLAEHRLFALQDRFRKKEAAEGEGMKALLAHIEAHQRALAAQKKEHTEGEKTDGNAE
ncbi:MAG: hypothetical protein J6M12_04900 [Clostridia bacterium]|nr:hypothetical protein [Clostridia bacterium]